MTSESKGTALKVKIRNIRLERKRLNVINTVRGLHFLTFLGRFAERIGFSGVLGAVYCTVIRIARPKEHEEACFNYKHEHSLNVQMVNNTIMVFLHLHFMC